MNLQQPSALLPSFHLYTMEELLDWDLESDTTLPFYNEDLKICTGMVHQGLGDDHWQQRAPASGPIRSQNQLIQEILKTAAHNHSSTVSSRTIEGDQTKAIHQGRARPMDANDEQKQERYGDFPSKTDWWMAEQNSNPADAETFWKKPEETYLGHCAKIRVKGYDDFIHPFHPSFTDPSQVVRRQHDDRLGEYTRWC